MRQEQLLNFEKEMRNLLQGLKKKYRWGTMEIEQENLLDHQYKMAWIVQLMIAIERRLGSLVALDLYRLLQCAINHDIGETIVGDTLLPNKTEESEREEMWAYDKLMTRIVGRDLKPDFPRPIDHWSMANERTRMFWRMCENVGYLMYAMEQLKAGNLRFARVPTQSLVTISSFTNEFKSAVVIVEVFK